MKAKEIIKLGQLLRTKTQIEKMRYSKILHQQKIIYDEARRLKRLARESILNEALNPAAIELLHAEKYRSQLNALANRKIVTAESFQLAIQSARRNLQHALQRELAWAKTSDTLERNVRKGRNHKEERQSEQTQLTKFSQMASH